MNVKKGVFAFRTLKLECIVFVIFVFQRREGKELVLVLRGVVKVLSRQVIGGLCGSSHQTLFLRQGALLHGGRSSSSSIGVLRGGRTTVAKPEEDDDLANEHTKSTSSQTSQNPQSSRHDDETQDPRDGVVQTTVVHVVRVVVTRRGRASTPEGSLFTRREGAKWRRRRRAMVGTGGTVVHGLGAVLAMAALAAGETRAHLQHAGLGGGKQITHAREEQGTQTGGLTTALLPGHTAGGGFFDVGLGHVDGAVRAVHKSNGNGIHGHRVAVEIQNGESDLDHLEIGLFGR